MKEKAVTLLNESKTARWIALLLLSFAMFCSYIFMDILSPIKDLLETTRGWDSNAFGTYAGSETFLNVFIFFLIFAGSLLLKIFTRNEFEFDTDRYEITRYYRLFGYFRFRRESISFGDVQYFLLSNYDSGPVLLGKGFKNKEWYTVAIVAKNSVMRLIKAENDELDEVYELYNYLQEHLDLYFKFNIEFVESDEG